MVMLGELQSTLGFRSILIDRGVSFILLLSSSSSWLRLITFQATNKAGICLQRCSFLSWWYSMLIVTIWRVILMVFMRLTSSGRDLSFPLETLRVLNEHCSSAIWHLFSSQAQHVSYAACHYTMVATAYD